MADSDEEPDIEEIETPKAVTQTATSVTLDMNQPQPVTNKRPAEPVAKRESPRLRYNVYWTRQNGRDYKRPRKALLQHLLLVLHRCLSVLPRQQQTSRQKPNSQKAMAEKAEQGAGILQAMRLGIC